MNQAVENLLRRLDLKAFGPDEFEGEKEPNSWGRLFGGMVAAQALVSACRTVAMDPPRNAHSLHCYFLRPGNPDKRVHFSVDRIRDGRSFTTRRVVASQGDRAIFNMSVSFHAREEGFEHQHPAPSAPDPQHMKGWTDFASRMAERMEGPQRARFLEPRPIEMRFLRAPTFMGGEPSDGDNQVMFRAATPIGEDPLLHWAFLTYASDMSLLDNLVRPHGRRSGLGGIQMASLDHAVWLHHPDLSVNDWLLYQQDSPIATGARGLARGSIYDRRGRLVASVAQEGLMRPANG